MQSEVSPHADMPDEKRTFRINMSESNIARMSEHFELSTCFVLTTMYLTGISGRELCDGPPQSSRIVIQGWTATASSGFTTSEPISNTDIYSCLENCRINWRTNAGTRCRLITFNMETGLCSYFTKAAVSSNLTFHRHADMVVAGYSHKKFSLLPNLFYDTEYILYIDGVQSMDLCADLCHLHPTCNAACYSLPNTWNNCGLQSKTTWAHSYHANRSTVVS